MEEQNFNNPIAEGIMEIMVASMAEFEARGKGAHYKSIVLTVAAVFPEDRAKIYAAVGATPPKKKESGGAIIHRKKKTEGIPVFVDTGGCDNCPQSASHAVATGSMAVVPEAEKKVIKGTAGHAEADKIEEGTTFKTVEEVLDTFQNSTAAIRAWAQTQDITIPASVTKAATAARYVVDHFTQDDEDETGEE